MAPTRLEDDPVTAEYSIFLTSPLQDSQTLLLQYPNRARNRPYNARLGASPQHVRMKPQSGFLEVDIKLNTEYNFNKFQGLKWGDSTSNVGRQAQNKSGTYGPAAGFSTGKRTRAGPLQLKDSVERENELQNSLAVFHDAEAEGKVMQTQTLGGQIVRHDAEEEAGKPVYFIGAFRDDQLHLTRVDGTVQMRPQFHHIDAEEQRARILARRDAAALDTEPRTEQPRGVLLRNVKEEERNRPEDRMRRLLHEVEAEEWVKFDYVDEDEDEAYENFHKKMFVKDVDAAPKLKSGIGNEEYLDTISAPRHDGLARRRRRPPRKKEMFDLDGDEDGEAKGGLEARSNSAG